MRVNMLLTSVYSTLTKLSLMDILKIDKIKLFDISLNKNIIIITKIALLDKSWNK